jgi:hypothetical protein
LARAGGLDEIVTPACLLSYGKRMPTHCGAENAWRIRVDDEDGKPRGAGVLLDDRHVLTSAHVVEHAGASPGGPKERVGISSVVCKPEWSITAKVAPGSWVHREGTRRGDVALLRLDEPTPCRAGTKLWRAPISGGKVRAYGFPAAEPMGMPVEAELAGSGGREGEFAVLDRVRAGGPWIEKGYSGAGVVALDGEFKGRVIGIVVAEYVNAEARAAWMLPTETILGYLPQVKRYVAGEPTTILPPPEQVPADPLRLVLTQELARLLSGGWSGTAVLTGGATGTGSSWLVRLLRTADPFARAAASDAEFTGAPRATVLAIGDIDAAYDARGRSVDEVRCYLADRFGFRGAGSDLVHRLLRHKPPVCLVIVSADRAADPDALRRELLVPLARRARSRGIRLVLGFDGRAPAGLPHEVSLGPEPVIGDFVEAATSAQAQAAVNKLAAAEDAAAGLHAGEGFRFFGSPLLPRCRAPQLRVRLAVARLAEPNPELAAIRLNAVAALDDVTAFDRKLRRLMSQREELRRALELHRLLAERYFGAEDRQLSDLHAPASRELCTPPVDLVAARLSVKRYENEVNRRVDEEIRRGQV